MQKHSSGTRADSINLLWQFKRRCDQRSDLGLPMVHFKMMLEDPEYREDLLTRAQASGDAQLAALAQAVRAMGAEGSLASQAPPAPAQRQRADSGSAPIHAIPAQSRGSNASPFIIIGIALVAIVGLAWLVLQPRSAPTDARISVQGSITENQTWTSGQTYVLNGVVFVEPGARLTVEAGATVLGQRGSALIVTRGAQLYARGTATRPVVFSSAQPVGQRAAGDWGGVVLLGNAPVNQGTAEIEGVPSDDPRGDFGGDDPASSCGVVEYTRIEFAGFELSKDNELNSLTLGGCGSGTIVRYVQTHRGFDDGVEMFGGTVDLEHILVSGAGDDSIDWDMGWTGRAQFIAVLLYSGIGDNGFEGDNWSKNHAAQPRSNPTFYNVTMLADPNSSRVHRGMTLRRGTAGRFYNMLISGFNGEPLDIRDAATVAQIQAGSMDFGGILLHNNGPSGRNEFEDENGAADDDGGFDEAAFFAQAERAVAVSSTGLLPNAHLRNPPLLVPDVIDLPLAPRVPPQSEFWDEGARYFGAFRPGSSAQNSWIAGWTAFPEN